MRARVKALANSVSHLNVNLYCRARRSGRYDDKTKLRERTRQRRRRRRRRQRPAKGKKKNKEGSDILTRRRVSSRWLIVSSLLDTCRGQKKKKFPNFLARCFSFTFITVQFACISLKLTSVTATMAMVMAMTTVTTKTMAPACYCHQEASTGRHFEL